MDTNGFEKSEISSDLLTYTGERSARVAFPLGGIGAGMICLEGGGTLSGLSVRGVPEVFNEPLMFSALQIQNTRSTTRILEGPVPDWKIFFPWGQQLQGAGSGARGKHYGLPRFQTARFQARFPFARVVLTDPGVPVTVEITGWSPFIPGDADRSSLPVAALEYRFVNTTATPFSCMYSFHAKNMMQTRDDGHGVQPQNDGLVFHQDGTPERPWDRGDLSATTDAPEVSVDAAWFRGGWFDPLTQVWKRILSGEGFATDPPRQGEPSPGGSFYVPFDLPANGEHVITLRLAWYVPETDLCIGGQGDESVCSCGGDSGSLPRHRPWYSGQFRDITSLVDTWRRDYEHLKADSERFSHCLFDTTLPEPVVEAVTANLSILKSPTVMRQQDGRLWCWEGCCDTKGCCYGSCTHVWNYAQAIPHLFPDLERSLRETEFGENQNDAGHQDFRAWLPIRPTPHRFHAAADGQLGGIVKVYREWRISGDSQWLKNLWPRVRSSLDYAIDTWDPRHNGVLEEPHHNTYDIEFWGPDGMCSSFYLAALQAACLMGEALDDDISLYRQLLKAGKQRVETELWNGDCFVQNIRWQGLDAGDPTRVAGLDVDYSEEAKVLLQKEGPKYQYGNGCLSDGVIGFWMAWVSGMGDILDREKVLRHLKSVYRFNFRTDLSEHANPQRPTYALGQEGGLLLCTWPHGGEPSLPFVYCNEVWTGIEYQVASHLMAMGEIDAALDIVRTCRSRYDGRVRNPFDEYECGHWYARALASYALLQACSGVRYDAVDKTLVIAPIIPGDLRVFLATASGYGTAGVRDGKPFLEVVSGEIPVERWIYHAAE